jgi:hypothetical protein
MIGTPSTTKSPAIYLHIFYKAYTCEALHLFLHMPKQKRFNRFVRDFGSTNEKHKHILR